MTKEFLLKCIKLRQEIEKSDTPKQDIEKLPFELKLALLIGFNITSIEELTKK